MKPINTLRKGCLIRPKSKSESILGTHKTVEIYRYLDNGYATDHCTLSPDTILLLVDWEFVGHEYKFHILWNNQFWYWSQSFYWHQYFKIVG